MKVMTLEETIEHIRNYPTSHDIQVLWDNKAGRLRRLIINEDNTVTFKTNHEEITLDKDLVSFNRP